MKLVGVALVLVAATARAEIVQGPPTIDGFTFARQVIAADSSPASTVAQSKTIYLNRGGIVLSPGDNDARTNKTTLVKTQTQIPGWSTTESTWNATVACMRELFAPFDVTIVTTDPASSVPHIEAVFGGTPNLMGMERTITGVAPFKSDCTILENAMVFAFTGNMPNDARLACEVMAQEVAHAYGLDHEMLPTDPLTYLRYDGNRSFQNQLAECGEDKARPCGVSGSASCRGKQNSVKLLFERLGPKVSPNDFTAPVVAITSPANGAVVDAGFEVKINATDNARVTMASIYIDDVPSGSSSVAPWTIKTPANMLRGQRKIAIEVTDGRQTSVAEVTVTVQNGFAPATDDDLSGGCSTSVTPGCALAFLALLFRKQRSGSRRS